MNIIASLISDSYKQSHYQMYPNNLTKLYSNFTARKSRKEGINKIVFFGLQYYLLEYLVRQWNDGFFNIRKEDVINVHAETVRPFSTGGPVTKQWENLHELGYLPIRIKAVPEGTRVPIGVPMLTVTNTHPDFAWLVNFIETQLSMVLWMPITSATIADDFKKDLLKWAIETGGDPSFVDFQGHDFSMRGMPGLEAACLSGAGHLTSFKGSDTIPAASFLKQYYGSDGFIAGSVAASEHSVMSVGGKEDEIETFEKLLDTFPDGILSVVSDTWDLWKVCTKFLPKLKDKILARNGKLVIRPDSGNPADIICGTDHKFAQDSDGTIIRKFASKFYRPKEKGVIELLWEVFGGTVNEKGYKVLDPHIGAIYGDSITSEKGNEICRRLKEKGFCSTNIVFGIGSFSYQFNTRDTFGMAMKATYCEKEENFYASPESLEPGVKTIKQSIFKDPVTDSGEKRSAKGLLAVIKNKETGELELHQEVDEQTEQTGELKTVFEDGRLVAKQSLDQIRNLLNETR